MPYRGIAQPVENPASSSERFAAGSRTLDIRRGGIARAPGSSEPPGNWVSEPGPGDNFQPLLASPRLTALAERPPEETLSLLRSRFELPNTRPNSASMKGPGAGL